MKIEQIPEEVLEAVRERKNNDFAIEEMSAQDLFSEYCNWHGLYGWGRTLWRVVDELQKAEAGQ